MVRGAKMIGLCCKNHQPACKHWHVEPWIGEFQLCNCLSDNGVHMVLTAVLLYCFSAALLLAFLFPQDDEDKAPKATLEDKDEDDEKDEL
jgi:hypothetical protein